MKMSDDSDALDQDDAYVVERIIKKRVKQGIAEYFVKWQVDL